MLELLVLGSECAISDQYTDLVIEAAEESGIKYSIRKIENTVEIESYGVQQGCLLGYCPGCHRIASENLEQKFTPALVVNGEVKTHGGYHGKEEIKKLWTNM